MTVYFITLLLVFLLCSEAQWQDITCTSGEEAYPVRHSSSTRTLYRLAALVLIFVAGLRFRVGTDFGAYYSGYQTYADEFWNNLRELKEPGYGFLSWVASMVYNDGAAAIFSASLVTIGLSMLTIYRNTRELLMATVLLVVMGYWHGSFNGVAQYLAAAVLFCGYPFLRDGKLLRWLSVVFLAYLFHRSAAVMALIYLVVHREISWRSILLLLLGTWIALRSYNRLFDLANALMDKNYSTDNEYTSTLVNRFRVAASCVPAALLLFEYMGKDLSRNQTYNMNLVILHAVVRVATMNSALLYRASIYTNPFAALAIAELLKDVPRKGRNLAATLIVGMYIVMWWYELSIGSTLKVFHWVWQR